MGFGWKNLGIKESSVNNLVNSGVQLGTGGMLGYNPSNGLNSGVVGDQQRRINPVMDMGYNAMGAKGPRFGDFLKKEGAGGANGTSVNAAGIVQPDYLSQLSSPTYQSMQSQYSSGSASPWANIAIARQGNLAEKQKQELADRNAGQTAGSLDKLAAVGGLTSGARERTIQGGQQNYMTGVQDIGNAYGQNVMNIGIDDAQNKSALGKGLMTAEMGDLTNRNLHNQNKYNKEMEVWAAKQQADATRASGGGGGGGGGCFITTAVCDHLGLPDDSDFLNTFRKFRDEYMGGKNSEELKKYYAEAPAIVEKINGLDVKNIVWGFVVDNYLVPAYFAIVRKDNDVAHDIYKRMFNYLKSVGV